MGWNDRMGVGPSYEDMFESPEACNAAYHAAATRAQMLATAPAELTRIRREIADINATYAGMETFTCRYCGQEYPMHMRILQACRWCAECHYD